MPQRRRRKGNISAKTFFANIRFYLAICSVFALGTFLLIRAWGDMNRSKDKYNRQQAELSAGAEQEEQIKDALANIDNSEMFVDIARKNGYRFENEEVVNITRPFSEDEKWK